MNKKAAPVLISFFILLSFICFMAPAKAEPSIIIQGIDNPTEVESTIKTPDDIVTVGFAVNSLKQTIAVKLMNILPAEGIVGQLSLPDNKYPQTELYYFSFGPKSAQFNSRPQIKVKIKDSNFKQVYYFDWLSLKFIPASTTLDASSSLMIFDLPAGQTELMFAVFGDKELIGNASWYVHPKYVGELIAASTDFAMDTKLKVIAVNSGKEVIVTVKDYGPDKIIHPDRVVDLSKEAFSVLAPTGAGVIKVKVLPAD